MSESFESKTYTFEPGEQKRIEFIEINGTKYIREDKVEAECTARVKAAKATLITEYGTYAADRAYCKEPFVVIPVSNLQEQNKNE